MTILLLGLTLFATTLGAMRLPLANLWSTGDEVLRHIWLTIRLPRVLLALLVGSALALSGCVMQELFRNPLTALTPDFWGSAAADTGRLLSGWCCRYPSRRLWRCMPRCWRRHRQPGGNGGHFCVLSKSGDSSLSRLLLVGMHH